MTDTKEIVERLRRREQELYLRGGARKNENGNWDCFHSDGYEFRHAADLIDRLSKRVEELEAGLEPFATFSDHLEGYDDDEQPEPEIKDLLTHEFLIEITVGDYRKARALLTKKTT